MNTKRWIALLLTLVMVLSAAPLNLAYGAVGCNHNWRIWYNSATCTEWGIITYYCTRCNDWYEDEAPPLGHDWGEWELDTPATCIQYATYKHTCNRCGLTLSFEYPEGGYGDHDWGEWVRVQEPTPDNPGLEERVCNIYPGHVERREVPYTPASELEVYLTYKVIGAPAGALKQGDQITLLMTIHNNSPVAVTARNIAFTENSNYDTIDGWTAVQHSAIDPGATLDYIYVVNVTDKDAQAGTVSRQIANEFRALEGQYKDQEMYTNWVYPTFNLGEKVDVVPYVTLSWAPFSVPSDVGLGSQIVLTLTVENHSDVDVRLVNMDVAEYPPSDTAAGWKNVKDTTLHANSSVSFPYGIVVSLVDVDFVGYAERTINIQYSYATDEGTGYSWTNIVKPRFELGDKSGAKLHLTATVAPDAGEGKRYVGAQIDINCVLSNEGSVTLYVPKGDSSYAYTSVPHGWEVGPDGYTYMRLEPGETIDYIYLWDVTQFDVDMGYTAGSLRKDAYTEMKVSDETVVFSNYEQINVPLTAPTDENYLDVYLTYSVEYQSSTSLQEGDEIWLVITVHNDSDVEIFLEDSLIDLPYANWQDDVDGFGAVQHSSVFAHDTKTYPYTITVSAQDIADGIVVRPIANTFTPYGGQYDGMLMQTDFIVPTFDLEDEEPTPAYKDVEAKLTWAYVSSDKPITTGSKINIELTVWNLGDVDITVTDIGVAELYAADDFTGWYGVKGSTIPAHGTLTYPMTIVAHSTDVDVFGFVERHMLNSYTYIDETTGEEVEDFTNEVNPVFNLDGFVDAAALLYEVSWAPDAGAGKRYEGAEVEINFTLTNIGNCEIVYERWYLPEFNYTTLPAPVMKDLGFGQAEYYVMAPGDTIEYTYAYTVGAAEAASGAIQYKETEAGQYLDPTFTWKDELGHEHEWWETVYSNTVQIDIPLTEEANAALHFDMLWWGENAGEGKRYAGAIIPLREVYTNIGDVPLYMGGYNGYVHDFVTPHGFISGGEWGGYAMLNPGESIEYIYDYQVTAADVAKGVVEATEYDYAEYTGSDGKNGMVYSNKMTTQITLTGGEEQQAAPALTMIVTQVDPAGDEVDYPVDDTNPPEILYDIALINTGDVALDVSKITFTWHATDGTEWVYYYMTSLTTPLYPGESWAGYVPFEVFSNRVNTTNANETYAGEVDVHILCDGYYVGTDQVAVKAEPSYDFLYKVKKPTDGNETPEYNPSVSVYKEVISSPALVSGYQLGEPIVYEITVTNTGDVRLEAIEIHDELNIIDHGYSVLDMYLVLEPGESYTATFEHRVNLDDVANGYVYNQAFAWWDNPNTGMLEKDYSNSVVVPVTNETSMWLKKSVLNAKPNNEPFYEGEEIIFEIEAHNSTPHHVYNIYVHDDLYYMEDAGNTIMSYSEFGPGEGATFELHYTVTAADAAKGYVANSAYGLYMDKDDIAHMVTSNEVIVPCQGSGPFGVITDVYAEKIETSFPANGSYYAVGETITYDIVVTNTGEVPVDIIVYDSLKFEDYGEIGSEFSLYPTDSRTYHYQWTVTEYDATVTGYVLNYALVWWCPTNGWGGAVTKSNEVWSPTAEEPNPVPPPFTPKTGDSCELTLTGFSAYASTFTQHFCEEHAAVLNQAETLIADKGDEAWPEVQQLWRDALDAGYQELLDAVSPVLRVNVLSERMNFYLWLSSYERALELIYPDDPAAVGELMQNALMDRCAEVCYVLHHANDARADVTAGRSASASKSSVAPGISRSVLERVGNNLDYIETLNEELAAIQASMQALTAGTQGKARIAAFERAQALWQANLDASVNLRCAAADEEACQIIAMNRAFLDQMLDARMELYEALYDEATAAELIAREYQHSAMYLYEEK